MSSETYIEYLRKEDVIPIVKDAAEKIKKLPNVLRIGYFGSFVRNDQIPGSDIDIFIELADDDCRWFDPAGDFIEYFDKVPCVVEIFAFTRQEMSNKDNKFYQEVLQELVEL